MSALPPKFTLLWMGSAASQLGSMNIAIALPLLALSLSHSPAIAGAVTAARTFPNLLLYLPAGLIVDRFDHRKVMVACQCLRLSVAITLVVALAVMPDPVLLLIAAAAVDGTLMALYNLAEASFVRHLVPTEHLADAIARNEARNHLGQLAGRPVGTFLYGASRSYPFIAYAFTLLLSILLIRNTSPRRTRHPPTERRPLEGNFRDCLRRLLHNPFLRLVLIVCTFTNFAFQTTFLSLLIQAEDAFQSNAMIGVLFAASGLGGMLGAITAPLLVRKNRQLRTVFICIWAWFALTLIIWLGDQVVVGLLAWGGISYVGAHVNVALTVCQSTSIPPEMQARVTGINSFVTRSAVPLGSLFAGYLLSVLPSSRDTSFLVFLVTFFVAIGVTVYGGKRRKVRPADLVRGVRSRLRSVAGFGSTTKSIERVP